MAQVMSREWGLLLIDEVHEAPTLHRREGLGQIRSHCKLGLTATLVREDELVSPEAVLVAAPCVLSCGMRPASCVLWPRSMYCVVLCVTVFGGLQLSALSEALLAGPCGVASSVT
jgi:hypothetical protein